MSNGNPNVFRTPDPTPANSNQLVLVIAFAQVEGIHAWPQCPFPEVGFLRSPHRHVFHIRAAKRVTHTDRDVEIIKLSRAITEHLQSRYAATVLVKGFGTVCDFNNMSCEMIAQELVEQFDLYCCEVLEDGENGAVVYTQNAATKIPNLPQEIENAIRKVLGEQTWDQQVGISEEPVNTCSDTPAQHAADDPSADVRSSWVGCEVEGRFKGLTTLFLRGPLPDPTPRIFSALRDGVTINHVFLCPDVVLHNDSTDIANFVGHVVDHFGLPCTVAVFPEHMQHLHPYVLTKAHVMLDIHAHIPAGLKPTDTIKIETSAYTTFSATVEQMSASKPQDYALDKPTRR